MLGWSGLLAAENEAKGTDCKYLLEIKEGASIDGTNREMLFNCTAP